MYQLNFLCSELWKYVVNIFKKSSASSDCNINVCILIVQSSQQDQTARHDAGMPKVDSSLACVRTLLTIQCSWLPPSPTSSVSFHSINWPLCPQIWIQFVVDQSHSSRMAEVLTVVAEEMGRVFGLVWSGVGVAMRLNNQVMNTFFKVTTRIVQLLLLLTHKVQLTGLPSLVSILMDCILGSL